jgi:hypothetical protein
MNWLEAILVDLEIIRNQGTYADQEGLSMYARLIRELIELRLDPEVPPRASPAT